MKRKSSFPNGNSCSISSKPSLIAALGLCANFAPVYSIPVQVSPLGYKPLPLIPLTRCISPEVISGSRLYKRIRAYECPRDLSQARVLITYFDVFPSSQGT